MRKINYSSDIYNLHKNSDKPVLVVFVSVNCPHSEILLTHLMDLNRHLKDGLDVCYFYVSDDPMLAISYGIAATPTALLIHVGAIVQRWVGVHRFHVYYDACQAVMDSTPVGDLQMLLEQEDEQEVPY